MKVIIGMILSILAVVFMFCIWVFVKTSGRASDMEEQMELERKLRNKNEKF